MELLRESGITLKLSKCRFFDSSINYLGYDIYEFQSFSSLKEKLVERPILSLYNPKLDTELHTDASALGIGGILLQWQEYSHVLKKFRVYLLGLCFKVITDCHALTTTLTKRDIVPRIARWWLLISEFTFEIEYRPGTQMAHVDALSRNTKLNETGEDLAATVYSIDTEHWLLTLQMTDPDVSRIINVHKPENDEESKDIKKNYVFQGNKLYRKVDNGLRMVVPRGARFQICRANHDD